MNKYAVENISIEKSENSKEFKKFLASEDSKKEAIIAEIVMNDFDVRANPIIEYDTLEEAKANTQFGYSVREGNTFDYLLIDYSIIWEYAYDEEGEVEEVNQIETICRF